MSNVLLYTDLRSAETLNFWIFYCLIHSNVSRNIKLVKDYHIPINPKLLSYLVIDNTAGIDALACVVRYIVSVNKKATKNLKLFSLIKIDGTLDFGLKFALSDNAMNSRLADERSICEDRKTTHWKEVLRKQSRAKALRAELFNLREVESRLSSEYRSALESHNASRFNQNSTQNEILLFKSKERTSLSSYKNSQNSVRQKEREINACVKSPAPVINAIPADDEEALLVIFFLMIPDSLNFLAKFSVKAQQMLVPREPFSHNQDKTVTSVVNDVLLSLKNSDIFLWSSHYDKYKFSSSKASKHCDIRLTAIAFKVPETIGSSTVDEIGSNENNGIW